MSERIRRAELDRAFKSFVVAAHKAGVEGTETWRLTHGSKTYGNSYGVFALGEHGSHGTVYGFTYLGFTAREAYDRLDAATDALRLVIDTES